MRKSIGSGLIVMALALSACAPAPMSGSSGGSAPVAATAPAPTAAIYAVRAVQVRVPDTLRVSEANLFYPLADIVWRGDPAGNRYTQVKAIFDAAATRATRPMTKGPRVVAEIDVQRFHCLTEKARYSVGGVHSIEFLLTVRDARTGALIDGPRKVKADLPASGGNRAIAEDAAGMTQKVLITDHLERVIRAELSRPASPAAPATGD
ncbi:hypothetical protein EOM89_06175 [Candidatus Falkowbacteria bacterium]|nr:hypothetical protein [Candidatus Falkowbacteria bacterium]